VPPIQIASQLYYGNSKQNMTKRYIASQQARYAGQQCLVQNTTKQHNEKKLSEKSYNTEQNRTEQNRTEQNRTK